MGCYVFAFFILFSSDMSSAFFLGQASQVVLVVKNLPANAGDLRDMDSIPGSGRYPGGGHSNLLQCSCLENPIIRGAWWAAVHRVTELDITEVTYLPVPTMYFSPLLANTF